MKLATTHVKDQMMTVEDSTWAKIMAHVDITLSGTLLMDVWMVRDLVIDLVIDQAHGFL